MPMPADDDDEGGADCSNSVMKPMYVIASRSVSIRDSRFSYANVGTLRRSLSNASFRLYMRRRSRMLAARRCASVATLRRIFFDDAIDVGFCEPPLPLRTQTQNVNTTKHWDGFFFFNIFRFTLLHYTPTEFYVIS